MYDVAVLGGGPGGYTAAFRAADLGLSVCLIEKEPRLGGTCLNVGCIPSKTLLHATMMVEEAEEAQEWGVHFTGAALDPVRLLEKKEEVIAQLSSGLMTLCKKRKIVRLEGTGALIDANTLAVNGEEITFRNLILATGSLPFQLPDLPEDPRIWDSTDALALRTIPERLLIIGGGIIGLEMAQVYHGLGSEITIVELANQLIPIADKDMVHPLVLRLKKRYTIHLQTEVTAVHGKESSLEVEFAGKKAPESAEFDAVLVAVGRRPNSAGFGLEELGVAIDEKGFVSVNGRQQTRFNHIYAVGDLVGNPMLAHKATHEGRIAAENVAGHDALFISQAIPVVAYTHPELAWVGFTEKEVKAQGMKVVRGKFPWGASGRAVSMGAFAGVTKALFDSENGKLLGAAICGINAGELIHEAALALAQGMTAQEIAQIIHAHPTLAETFACAAQIVDGSITEIMPAKKR